MPAIKAVVFDCYGTLVDILTNEWKDEVFNHLSLYLRYYGVNSDPVALKAMYRAEKEYFLNTRKEQYPEFNLMTVFKTILKRDGVDNPFLVESCCKLFRLVSRERFQVFPDTWLALKELRAQNHPLAMLSNAQDVFFQSEIDMLGLRSYFNYLVVSSYWGFRKPDPRLFSLTCTLCNVKPSEAVYIGDDAEVDVRGARQAGMQTILIDREQKQKNKEPKPDFYTTNLVKAAEWIKDNP